MHILHVVQLYRPVPSGAARYFVELGERFVRDGHRVTVLTTDAFDLEHLWMTGRRSIAERDDQHNGVQVRRLPIARLPAPPIAYPVLRRLMYEIGRTLPAPQAVPILRRLAQVTPRLPDLPPTLAHDPRLHDVDLVHSTNITLDFMLLPIHDWAARRGIPVISTPFVHLGEAGNPQIVRYYSMPHQLDLLRRSAAVIAQTDLEHRFLQTRGIAPARLHTIGVGVTPADLRGGDAARFRQAHGLDRDTPIVLSLGAAAYDKGTLHTLAAMQRLWQAGSRAVWVQIGPMLEHFEQEYAALPAPDRARTRVLGFVPDAVRLDALAAADVLVLPSRTDSFGIVFLEAWWYEKPVVGAWAGGIPAVVRHGENGVLVPFGDVPALARAIERLVQDRTLAQAFGRLGRQRVQQHYTWEQKYQAVRAVCAAVLQQQGRGAVAPRP